MLLWRSADQPPSAAAEGAAEAAPPTWREKFLSRISDPNIAYLLMLAGVFGLIFELQNPGSVLPGVVGGLSLLTAAFALQMLPVNWAGAALFVLAIVPALVLPLLSPLVGQTYGVDDALVHGACLFIRGSVFFSLAFLLSTVFADVWRPALIALCALAAVGLSEQVFHDALPAAWFHVMSAESYFRGEGVPWPGLFVSALVSTAMLYGAVGNISRRDF